MKKIRTIKEKVETACAVSGITLTELSKRMGMSQANLSKRLKVGKFSQDELVRMGIVLGCEWKSGFHYPNGNIIE